jgi:hypothetical protein
VAHGQVPEGRRYPGSERLEHRRHVRLERPLVREAGSVDRWRAVPAAELLCDDSGDRAVRGDDAPRGEERGHSDEGCEGQDPSDGEPLAPVGGLAVAAGRERDEARDEQHQQHGSESGSEAKAGGPVEPAFHEYEPHKGAHNTEAGAPAPRGRRLAGSPLGPGRFRRRRRLSQARSFVLCRRFPT